MISTKQRILQRAWNWFATDLAAAIVELSLNRAHLALSPDDERRLSLAVPFSIRTDRVGNVGFCAYTLARILEDDVSGDLARTMLEESVRVAHPVLLALLVPLFDNLLEVNCMMSNQHAA